MRCPRCGKEMEAGYFYGQRALWSPKEDKFTILQGKGDMRISASGSPAYRCDACRKIVVTVDY